MLSLQRNRLNSISDGLSTLHCLEELYLSENHIGKIENMDSLTNLIILDLGRNQIEDPSPVRSLFHLEELWLNNNSIKSVQCLEFISDLKQLVTLYVEFNSLIKDTQYRRKIRSFLPTIKQVLIRIQYFPLFKELSGLFAI